MVVGLLAWLAWDVETDISVASQRGGLEGLENQQWYAGQLLAALGPWLVDDDAAWATLEESVARKPAIVSMVSGGIAVHRSALETFALVVLTPDEHRQTGRRVKPGDLVVLGVREAPRVRVVLDVRQCSDGDKVVMRAPDAADGERSLPDRRLDLMWSHPALELDDAQVLAHYLYLEVEVEVVPARSAGMVHVLILIPFLSARPLKVVGC